MIKIDIPGHKTLKLSHLVLDHNGTLACDGNLLRGVGELLEKLSAGLEIHVLTADTFGKAKEALEGVPCRLSVLAQEAQDTEKLKYVKGLGADQCACIGNGRNDRLMVKGAALGIAVVQEEGAAAETILAADVVSPDIVSALNLLVNPLRLVATLRS